MTMSTALKTDQRGGGSPTTAKVLVFALLHTQMKYTSLCIGERHVMAFRSSHSTIFKRGMSLVSRHGTVSFHYPCVASMGKHLVSVLGILRVFPFAYEGLWFLGINVEACPWHALVWKR